MGQNIYMKSSTEKGTLESSFKKYIPEMVKGWYDEVKLYNYGDPFSAATGHYTQVSGSVFHFKHMDYENPFT